MLVVEAARARRGRSGRRPPGSRPGRSTARARAANSGSSSTIEDRLSHGAPRPTAAPADGQRDAATPARIGSVKLTRVPARRPAGRRASAARRAPRPGGGRCTGRGPVPGIRDSRTFQARWNGSMTRARSASGMPTPSSSTVTASQPSVDARPRRRPATRPARTSGRCRRGSRGPARSRAESTSIGGRSVGQVQRRAGRSSPGDVEVAAQPRDERRERAASARGSAGRPRGG